MTLARNNRTDAATYATSLIGLSRDVLPIPWTDSAAIDDCARFCSHVLWGGKPGPISWVDNFKTAGDGAYAAGSGDLQPWDVLLFDWEHNGVGNHVEFFVSHDADPRYVRTFGANGSDTKAAAYRRRPVSYILGRFRPAWTVQSSVADEPHQTITTPNRRHPVNHILQAPYRKGGPKYSVLIEPGTATLLDDERFRYWSGLKDSNGVALYPVVQGNERSLALAREHRSTVSNKIKLR